MAVVISHSSALSILRAVPPQTRALKLVEEPLDLTVIGTRSADASVFDVSPFGIKGNLHVLTSRTSARNMPRGIVCHSSSLDEVPAGLLFELRPDVYVCGPEFVFLQMAQELSPVGLTVLGYELCGHYSQFAPMVSGFYDRKSLTSVDRIAQVLCALRSVRGLAKSHSALAYVCDGSHSPMETVVSAMLYLPVEMGGYGLLRPTLNRRVTLDAAAAARLGQKSCMIDACWPESRIGLEYDSSAYHPDPEWDRMRREALSHMGWTIYTLSPDDVSSAASLGSMVDLFVDKVPQARRGSPATDRQHADLLHRLFVLTRRGLGLGELLFFDATKSRGVKVHL